MYHDVDEADITRAWLLAVIDIYDRIRGEIPELRRMKPANFEIDPKLFRTLGCWEVDTRLIRLSTRLFEHGSWAEMESVLRHEMAHQVVDEVFGAPHEPPHGPAFKRAARLLGAAAGATIPVTEAEETPARIVLKIQKLLALGTSPHHKEAEAALNKAHELMLRYNLRQLDLHVQHQYLFRPVGKPYRRIPGYVWHILGIVGDFYFVQYICRIYEDSRRQFDGGRWRVLELYGNRENLDLAEYIFYFLLRQGHAEWEAYRASHPTIHGRQMRSFLDGVYQGFRQTLERQRRKLEKSEALIWRGDPELDAYFRKRNPYVRHRSVESHVDRQVHADGIAVGSNLRVRPGLTRPTRGKAEKPRGYLMS